MIARIISLLGFGGVDGSSAQNSSANGPAACPLCCGRHTAAAKAPSRRPYVRQEVPMSLLHGYIFSDAGNLLTSQRNPTK